MWWFKKKDFKRVKRHCSEVRKLTFDRTAKMPSCDKDDEYSLPSYAEVEHLCKKLWSTVAKSHRYVEEWWDCDDFAMFFRCHAHLYSVKLGYNIACAYVEYDCEDPEIGLHAINAILTHDKGFVYIEPQRCEIVELSVNEITTIKTIEY